MAELMKQKAGIEENSMNCLVHSKWLSFLMLALLLVPTVRVFAAVDISSRDAGGNMPCHSQPALTIHAGQADLPARHGGSDSCCEEPGLVHDCGFCFVTLGTNTGLAVVPVRSGYTMPPRIKYFPLTILPENPFRPPRYS